MFCLLCHEKVPRLRAWRTKSEFCCDEHAELYKRQTLERLLTDEQDSNPAEAPPLPLDNSRSRPKKGDAAPEPESTVAETLARFAEPDKPTSSVDELLRRDKPAQFEGEDSDEGVRELWRLAEEVGPGASGSDDDWASGDGLSGGDAAFRPAPLGGLGGLGGGSGTIREQTAEEALAALRALSSGPRRSGGSTALGDSGNDFDALVASRATEASRESEALLEAAASLETEAAHRPFPSRAESLEELDDLEDIEQLPASLDEALPDEDSLPPLDMGALEPLDDDELPSILDRLTENDPVGAEFDSAQEAAESPLDSEAVLDEEEITAEELSAGNEQPAEAAVSVEEDPTEQAATEEALEAAAAEETATEEPAEETLAIEEPIEAGAGNSSTSDLFEEAVESHLEEPAEKPAERSSSRKVVPFPVSRPKPAPQPEAETEADPQPAVASASREKQAIGLPKGKRKTAEPGRVNMKPVTVMFGLEPSLFEPAANGEQPDAGLAALAGLDGTSGGLPNSMAEPPLNYPDTARPCSFTGRLPVHARLYPALPEMPEAEALSGDAERPDSPDYSLPCMAPPPLVLGSNGKPRKPSLGSERAWMVQIEPTLAEAAEIEIALPNGNNHTPWQSPLLPAALLAGMAVPNGSGKLDLSGPQGRHEPPIDRLCWVLPELGELGGSPKRPSSNGQDGESAGWMPPSVLDPSFDIERPAGRDLSDFG
jgi:hypothetical protein